MIKIEITPKFNTKQIIDETIKRDWFELQSEIFSLGNLSLKYIRNHININKKNKGTGKLAKSIDIDRFGGFGKAYIGWGIGKLSLLRRRAPWWAIINFGGSQNIPEIRPRNKKVLKFKGKDGNDVYASKTRPRINVIRNPINYISATRAFINAKIANILIKLKLGRI